MSLKIADVKNEYIKDKKLRESDIMALREWLQKQPHLPEISELQLVQFLQSCYYSVEIAKITIDNFYTVRTHFAEVFSNRSVNWAPLKDAMGISLYRLVSGKTSDNHAVLYCKIVNGDVSRYSFAEQLKCFDMCVMLWLRQNGTAEGLHIISDMSEISFGHMAKLGLVVMKKFMFYLQEAMPIRLKGLHFINVVPFMDKVMALMRPFMKKELMDVLYIHAESMDSLYKHVPKDCLPKDLGGSEEPIEVLHEKMKKELAENTEYFQMDEKLHVDESKRPGKPKNEGDIFGVEGTFKNWILIKLSKFGLMVLNVIS